MSVNAPSLINEWAEFEGLTVASSGPSRRLAVTFDRVRVHLVETPGQGVLVESRIADIPLNLGERDRLIQRAMTTSTARLRDSAVTLCADKDACCLLLQVQVPSGSDVRAMSSAVQNLVNEVDLWRTQL